MKALVWNSVFISDPDLETVERAKFIKGFTTKNGDNKKGEANALELKELGADLAEKILKFWMSNINRTLTNFQVRIAKPFLAFLPSRSKNRNVDILRKFAADCQSRSILWFHELFRTLYYTNTTLAIL